MPVTHRQALRAFDQLADLGDHRGAIARLREALAIDPSHGAAWSNLGVLLSFEGDVEGALAAHGEAMACRPEDAQFRVNRVVTLLRAGRLAEAWEDFEWRLHLPRHSPFPTELLMPCLAAQPDLTGRTILVTHEEGFGDTLQYARYLPLLAARGAIVLVAAPPALQRLLAGIPGVGLISAADLQSPGGWRTVDHVCPFVSLPRVFATTLESIPPAPYLTAAPGDARFWASKLPAGGCRVGLVWAGQARPWLPGFDTVDGRRSLSLAQLAPLEAIEGVRLISLQKGPAAAEAAAWPACFDPMAEVNDFADTAAIIAQLDLVISVDTAVAHLAGALGKPVFLLDRFDHCWRWLSGRTDSPWYPTLRIFRQTAIGAWPPVIAQAAAALAAFRDASRQCETVATTAG